jgi:putative flippase GtrA
VLSRAREAVLDLTHSAVVTIRGLIHELAKFGVVGLVALIVDIGLFNILRYAGGEGPFYDRPLTAKVISVIAATSVAFLGNRLWAFRQRVQLHMGRQYLTFFLLNGVAMGIALSCLWFSHYALGLTSPLADNISANVIGLGLGTLFRFWSYRRWVFPALPEGDAATTLIVERSARNPL